MNCPYGMHERDPHSESQYWNNYLTSKIRSGLLSPDPVSREQRKSGWKGVLAFGAAVAVFVIAVFSGLNLPGGSKGPGVGN